MVFTDAADGELLDGEKNTNFPSGNGTAGGNFVTTFTVSAGTSVSVGFADIARGPGQALQGLHRAAERRCLRLGHTTGQRRRCDLAYHDLPVRFKLDDDLGSQARSRCSDR